MDFVFIIDSSRSVRPRDYEKVKAFIESVLQFLDVEHEATRVGLLQYGSVVQNEFSLKTFQRKEDIQRAVRDMSHLASGTMTGLAIQYAMDVAFTEAEGARPAHARVPRVAMVITDGRPQDTVDEVADRARAAGIRIYAVGVGRVDMNTLRAIGSQPHTEHVYLVANFSQMESLTAIFQAKLCADNDPCSTVDHQCEHGCVSTPVSYACRCREGYTLNPDNKTCREQEACAVVEHGCEHICVNLPGSYECRCRNGYELNEDGKSCRRIDYCDLGEHGCEHDCVSTADSYVCRCKKGFVLNADSKSCGKTNRCALGLHGCHHECVNTEESFICRCRRGYALNPDGKTCTKTDQCALGSHGCHHECVNTEDSFECRCRGGYALNPDGKTCTSLDMCSTLDHGCEHLCVGTHDSFVCRCFEGYILEEDGRRCKRSACGEMDLIFVIDGSKSLGAANFELVKRFVGAIVDFLDVSPLATQVGLLQYSTKVRAEFTLGQFSSGLAVKEAVSRVQYMGRGSMTGSALRHMVELSFSAREGARPGVSRVSIVFTDGRSQDDVSKWAAKAHAAGITMYAVGVGKAIEGELREIASEPDDMHLHYAKDFRRMDQVADKLKSRICAGTEQNPQERCRCESMVAFQNQAAEQLKKLTLRLELMSKKLETLENLLGHN
ncbi:matrilin-2-like [Scleropages formosus]|uniref:matrilin-2-like n=1 Tax=Scleropages formosus TaxID=113540 RepID=UPI0010FAA6C6|nr:matrilin-2 [Scleropages formosus]